MKTKNYSDFLNQACAYVGVDYADLQPDEVALLNSFFNKQINHIWNLYHWVDVCPYGEYRVPNNILSNSITLSDWSSIGGAIVNNHGKNPVDCYGNSSLFQEAVGYTAHGAFTTYSVDYPGNHTFSVFLKPISTRYCHIGTMVQYSKIAIIDMKAASVVTADAAATVIVNRISGGWVQVIVNYEIPDSAEYVYSVYGSPDGVLFPYNTSGLGFEMYYPSIAPTDLTGTTMQLVPWEQDGMDEIDVVFEVWRTSPLSSAMPKRCPYKVTPNGIQTYNTAITGVPYYQILSPGQAASSITAYPPSPVYLYYRTRCPNYSGATYSTATGYDAGVTLYYTYADGVKTNYIKTLVATNPGDTPETTPEKFKVLLIPQFAFDFVVQGVLADWLMTERQFAKAQVVRMGAQEMMDREFDRQERQMGIQFPFKVHTHFTSRANPTR